MPKLQRTPEEIEQVKARILEKAAGLITETGYQGFTMRRLGTSLNITATTIYNYYKNKDDLFINLLIMGFTRLHRLLEEAWQAQDTPRARLRAMMSAYTDFGLTQVNFYNLMYAWHVPKYKAYAGTSMEPVARQQLDIALKVPQIFTAAITAYAAAFDRQITDAQTRFLLIHYWSHIHGFISGCNNTSLSYLHDDPQSLKEMHLDLIADKFRTDISRLTPKGEQP